MNGTQEYHSIGHMCALMQRDIRAIRQAAQTLEMEPALRLNNVPHFSADQVEQLTTYFRENHPRPAAAN